MQQGWRIDFSLETPVSRSILVVDDERAFLMAARKFFSRMGSLIDTVESVEDARRYLEHRRYDVVITDLRLTGMNGEEGFDILRMALEANPGTRCVMLSGSGNAEFREKALARGAAFFFEKPISMSDLCRVVCDPEAGA